MSASTASTPSNGGLGGGDGIGTSIHRRSASERDLVDEDRSGRRQNSPRDRGIFTLPRFPRIKSSNGRSVKYTSLENSTSPVHQSPNSARASRSTERKSFLSSIVRSFSVKRTAKKNISLSHTDLSRARNDEACDYDKPIDENPPVGLIGMKNHGNTCYLNSIVQCLSNTDTFAEYFVLNRYQVDLLYSKKSNRKKYGTKGEVTEQLALLIKSLWSSTMYPDISAKFKTLVGKYGPQYQGSEQHDAQEFLIWLLDKVHEDLNRANKTKYKKLDSKGTFGKPDEFLAKRALESHVRCNVSFVQRLFQGQFKLTLTCPLCRKECKTFDPYVCLSLPIPQKLKKLVPVHLVGLTGENRQIEFAVELFDDSTIRDLREKVSEKCRIPPKHLLFLQMLPDTEGGFGSVYADTDSINSLLEDLKTRGNSKFVTCLETPKPKKTNEHGEHIMIIWHNRTPVEGLFGEPYVIQVRRDIGFKDLRLLMLDTMSDLFCEEANEVDGFNERPIVPEFPSQSFSILCADMLPERNEIRASDDLPLYTDPVEHITAVSKVQYPSIAKHLRLLVEWRDELIVSKVLEPPGPLRDESLGGLDELDGETTVPVDLNDCLNAYFSEELLEAEEAWLCPTCERRQQVLSKLDLWTSPDILVIHLKRFKQVNQERSKIYFLVDFPTSGLDLSRFTAQRGESPDLSREREKDTVSTWSPWNNSSQRSPLRNVDPRNPNNLVYDLYAVCNHHGTMQGGHYTAFCKNPVNGLWYHYDDASVTTVTDESYLITKDAYILFYQRNTLNVSQSCSSSSSGYSSSSNEVSRHWSIHKEPFLYSNSPSRSFDNLYSEDRQAHTPQPRRRLRNTKRFATITSADRKRVNEQSERQKDLFSDLDKHVLGPATYCTVTSV
ncbi:ubiquitin carboxyl-terminal hydrolase 2 [Galendromus occidentalis]|uniref:Ubiquitin carboxyl-terminal hydrolase n=1 Tax=Galendromus occidentalis TaxID=34638 RepID=A0AAJ6QWP2_9ACAR|nr:ubiquitin carboxyl-terminal hydrolase 2 [Galendromus occidentalis]